jgi:lipid-binding SYLF domain-containing protein
MIMSKQGILPALMSVVVFGCGGTQTPGQELRLEDQVSATLGEMTARDPGVNGLLHQTYAYAVFPDVGKAGIFYVGGAYGNGILYENGAPTGLVQLRQGSLGLELGGETFSELVLLRDPKDVQRLKTGNFDLGADASAVALTAGAATEAAFRNGMAVLVMPRGGLMAGITITGQSIEFHPWIAQR